MVELSSWTGPQSNQAAGIDVSVPGIDSGQRRLTFAEMEVFEDADLESPILREPQGLIERLSIRNDCRKCPACERDNNECKSQHLDEAVPVSVLTSPNGVFHASYTTHLGLGFAGVRLTRHVVALHGHRVSEALRYPQIVVMSG